MNLGKTVKNIQYIKKILSCNPKFYKYEVNLILMAFLHTLWYFVTNCIEFEVHDMFKFKRYTHKASRMYVRYRDEYRVTPEHDDMKFVIQENLRDYLNSREKYKNVRHREILPDGYRRQNKIF